MDDPIHHLSKCEYVLRAARDGFTDADLEKICASVKEWGRNEEIICDTQKTENGFEVTFHLPEDDHEAYCTSLYFHLASDTFLDLEKRGLWMAHLED